MCKSTQERSELNLCSRVGLGRGQEGNSGEDVWVTYTQVGGPLVRAACWLLYQYAIGGCLSLPHRCRGCRITRNHCACAPMLYISGLSEGCTVANEIDYAWTSKPWQRTRGHGEWRHTPTAYRVPHFRIISSIHWRYFIWTQLYAHGHKYSRHCNQSVKHDDGDPFSVLHPNFFNLTLKILGGGA